jgi:hypothetical protein
MTTPAFAQASRATSVRVPIESSIPDGLLGHPCGTGDIIELSGTLHVVVQTTQDAAGGFHQNIEVNHQGISGVGLVSGADYRSIRASSIVRQQTNGAQVIVEVTNQRLIAQGSSEDFWLHSLTHLTFNAAGELTSVVVTLRASCEIIS